MPLIIATTGFENFLGDSDGAHIKALILGPPGAGKTRAASYWPKPIYADCEKGLMSVSDRSVPFGHVRSSAEMDELLNMLRLESNKTLTSRRFNTFVVDTVDSYQQVLIQERLKAERKDTLSGFADWGYLDAKMTTIGVSIAKTAGFISSGHGISLT